MDVRVLILVYVGLVFQVYCQVQNETLENRLKILENKFLKIDALLEGLEQICSKVEMLKDSGESDETDINGQNPKVNGDEDEDLVDFVPTIKVMSVESSGLVDDEIKIKVIFHSKKDCDIRWNARYENSSFLALQGEKQDKLLESSTTRVCAVSIKLSDIENLEWLLAVIFGQEDNVQLSFNITTLSEEGAEPIEKFEYRILRYPPTKVVTEDMPEGIEITVEVTSNVIDAINDGYSTAYSFLAFINSTGSPPEYSEAWSYSNDHITVEVKNGSDNKLVLGVGKELAKFGGYLSLRVEQRGVENKYLIDHQYGLEIRLVRREFNDIMPAGVIAIQKKEPVQYYRGQYHSLSCLGVSIPAPDVALFKVKSDGKLKQLPVDIDRINDMFHSQATNFYPTDAVKPEGTYVCRVSLGKEVVDTNFTVMRYVEINFDERKTGLTKNSPKETSISCKAFGVPAPDFELRINDEFGDDILRSEDGRYKYRVTKRKNNTKLTLTIEPADPDVSRIICLAKQVVGGRVGPTKSFPIDVK